MNVLTFTGLFPNNVFPNQGVFIKERVKALSQLDGVSLKVVAPVPYCPPGVPGRWASYRRIAKAQVIEGLSVTHPRYVMTPKVGMMFYGALLFLSMLPHIKQLRKTFDFDVIDAHFVYPDGFAAVLLGKLLRKPVVISARGSDINTYQEFTVIRHLLRYALEQASRVITVSAALKETIASLSILRDKITVVPNGVDFRKFHPVSKTQAKAELGFASRRIVLSVGHLTPVKGFDLLIRSVNALVEDRRFQDVLLVIVGEGPSRKDLNELVTRLGIASHVRLAGEKPHGQLGAWYNAADAFCLTSVREGWPNVILESLACGTPVVAVPVGGIPEILSSDKVGIIVCRQPKEVADGIAVALERTWDREALVAHAQGHSWESTAQTVSRVFHSAISSNG
jgi:glycosyltransferase involved in cell wall biosynthesis